MRYPLRLNIRTFWTFVNVVRASQLVYPAADGSRLTPSVSPSALDQQAGGRVCCNKPPAPPSSCRPAGRKPPPRRQADRWLPPRRQAGGEESHNNYSQDQTDTSVPFGSQNKTDSKCPCQLGFFFPFFFTFWADHCCFTTNYLCYLAPFLQLIHFYPYFPILLYYNTNKWPCLMHWNQAIWIDEGSINSSDQIPYPDQTLRTS